MDDFKNFIGFKKRQFNDQFSLGYVPSFDGMRAIAISVVMLLHAHFQLGGNGWIGVDMFFCLSGFLITTLLLQEKNKTGTISLNRFYIRRALRLFPALYIFLLTVLVYALFVAGESKSQDILKEIASSALYLYNIAWKWGGATIRLF